MNRKDFLKRVQVGSGENKTKEKLENTYGKVVPEEIVNILSVFPEPVLFDENESRTLSVNEVVHAEEDLKVPFKTNGIVPIAELGSNDYIVYSAEKKLWYIYNILDEVLFDESNSFEKLFLR